MQTRPLRTSDFDAIVAIMRSGELICSAEYIRDHLSQGVVLEDDGRVIGFCGIMPVTIWRKNLEEPAFQLGMLGMEEGHGVALSNLLDGVRASVGECFVYANTANKKGAVVWTRFYGMKAGPRDNARIRYRPIVPFMGFAPVDHLDDTPRWRTFIEELRDGNQGVMTARSILGWQKLKALCTTVEEEGRIVGAAFIRRRLFSRFKLPRYDIVDICALENNPQNLKKLLRKCCRVVASHGGLVLEYVGSPTNCADVFDSVLSWSRPAVSNTFVYKGEVDVDKGWFFGPYDGDRCIS